MPNISLALWRVCTNCPLQSMKSLAGYLLTMPYGTTQDLNDSNLEFGVLAPQIPLEQHSVGLVQSSGLISHMTSSLNGGILV